MSEDEKNFYYFKLHDSDNNDNLDGLEMLHAATHHHSKSDGQLHGIDRAATQTGDDRAPLLDDDEFNHIIGKANGYNRERKSVLKACFATFPEVIDDFIEFADTDKNGLLNYPEYINAINLNDPKTQPSTVDNSPNELGQRAAAPTDVPAESDAK